MYDSLVAGPLFVAFLLASLVLAATPGPGVVYIVARTLAQGRPAGLASVAGVAMGNLCNALGASLGLATLFALSSVAFTVVKLVGAAYLVYLGVKSLRQTAGDRLPDGFEAPRLGRIVRDGFLVALLNPKTALFFAAFLPQFMDRAASTVMQGAALGVAFVLVALVTDTSYVLTASLVASRLVGSGRFDAAGRYAAAATYFGLGIFTAATGTKGAR